MAPDAIALQLPVEPLLDATREQSACPVLDLPATPAEWNGTRAGRRWRKSWNRVVRHERVEVIETGTANAGDLFETLVSLHTRHQGVVTNQLSEPDRDGGELHEAHEVWKELVISCGNTPELLELTKEPFDAVPLAIEMIVVSSV